MSKIDVGQTEFLARYSTGKTIRETEYGVRYPNGYTAWGFNGFSRHDIRTEEGRADLLADRARQFAELNVPEVGKVEFLRRVVTRKFSEPVVVLSEHDSAAP